MTYRVIQWATGLVGQEAIRGVVAHPQLELVGAWVHSPEKVGRDVGEIAGIEPLGVTAVGTLEEVCAIEADAVVYAPVLASTSDVIALLESGKNVVTPVGWIYPGDRSSVRAIEAACQAAGVTLHGSGINPGGITERFPLTHVGVVPRHPPCSRRGVLGHPQLPDRERSCATSCCSARIPRPPRRARCSRCSATASCSRST